MSSHNPTTEESNLDWADLLLSQSTKFDPKNHPEYMVISNEEIS